MKLYNDFYFPDGDIHTPPAMFQEWKEKGAQVLSYVPLRDVVVQAGGNSGVFPVKLAKYFNRVFTFEPIEENWDCLATNVLERDIGNIKYFKSGLGSREGNAGVSRIVPGNFGATSIAYSDNGSINMTTIDDMGLDRLDLLWLDVEGFELEAIQGGELTIRQYKPIIVLENNGLIFGEYNPDGDQRVVDWMLKFGYERKQRIMRDDIYAPVRY